MMRKKCKNFYLLQSFSSDIKVITDKSMKIKCLMLFIMFTHFTSLFKSRNFIKTVETTLRFMNVGDQIPKRFKTTVS